MDITFNNAWVDSYLEALLSTGLSAEHVTSSNGGAPRFAALDEEQATIASYYVHQILSLDEDRIRDAWMKAASCARAGACAAERDQRIQYLSWRVWAMKRRRAEVEAALAEEKREGDEEVGDEEGLEDEVDATTLMTLDDLNSTAMADFEGIGTRSAGRAFGSVALDSISANREDTVSTDLAAEVPAPPAEAEQSWQGVKEYATGPPTNAPPGLTQGRPPTTTHIEPQQADATSLVMPSSSPALAIAPSAGKGSQRFGDAGNLRLRAESSSVATGPSTIVSPFASLPQSPAFKVAKLPSSQGIQSALGPLTAPAASTTLSPSITTGAQHAPDPLLVSRFPGLYIILISLHGLVRGEKMELGKDPDTGGQVKYVVELAKALGQFPSVARVDLLTRLIDDPKVDSSYALPEERLVLPPLPPRAAAAAAGASTYDTSNAAHEAQNGSPSPSQPQSFTAAQNHSASAGSSARGAFIVRLPCGPTNSYLRKEELWPHVREFADRAVTHASSTLARLQEGGPCELYIVHGHYADAGETAGLVASSLGVDCVLTGHSLGRNKKEHLLKSGTISPAEVEATYRISRRIEAEERALDFATVVFTSTQQEVTQQWGTYNGYSDELSAALQLRPCKGYHVPRMAVIPPGLDFSNLKVSMPVDPWEEVLGGGPPAPATPALEPAPPSSSGHGHAAVGPVGPSTPPQRDTLPAAADPTTELDLTEEPASVTGSGTSLLGRRERSAAPPVERTSSHQGGAGGHSAAGTPTRRTPTRQSWHGGPPTPTNNSAASNLATMHPSRMAALMVGESEPPMWREINRFLRHPGRPVILAMSRPDAKKNLQGLVRAYGNSRLLRELTNLVLIMGNRDKIDGMAPGSSRVLTEVLKLIDTYDLYGCVAYPKTHTQADISDIYLLATATRGVFVNPALQEPFGLTLIEAAAHGVPIVATTHGGPVDIVSTLKNGLLVEPTDTRAIADACTSLITAQRRWDEASDNGRRYITAYSWPSHCARYLRTVQDQKSTLASSGRLALFNANAAPADAQAHRIVPAPKMRHTLSLSYDDLGALARAIASSTTTSSSAAIIKDAVAVVAAAAAANGAGNGQLAASTSQPADTPAADSAQQRFTGDDRLPQQMKQAEIKEQEESEASRGDGNPARASTPPVQSDLRSTFSLPSSQALSAALRQSHRRNGGGMLNIPSPEDIAVTQADLARNSTAMASEGSNGTTPPPVAAAGGDGGDAMAAVPEGALDKPTETAEGPTPAGTPPPTPACTDDPTQVSDVPGSSTAAAKKKASDPQAWDGDSQAVQQVLAAAMDVLAQEAAAQKVETGDGNVTSTGAPDERRLAQSTSFRPLNKISTRPQELQPRMNFHDGYVVFNFDTIADVRSCGPVIKALLHASETDARAATYARLLTLTSASCGCADGSDQGSRDQAKQIGVGVMCPWGTKDLRALLLKEDIDPLALDFMVCDAGSLIWHSTCHCTETADSSAPTPSSPAPHDALANQAKEESVAGAGVNGNLLSDDVWEQHVDWRWDDRVVKQVLARILDNKRGWGRLNVVKEGNVPGKGRAAVAAVASAATDAATTANGASGAAPVVPSNCVAVSMSAASSPLHYMLDVEVLAPGTGTKGQLSTTEIARQLLSAIRRKLRMSGLRAQLLVTPREALPNESDRGQGGRSSAGGTLSALLTSIVATLTRAAGIPGVTVASSGDPLRSFTLHVTPLRCSRALALRYLASRSRCPLETCWTLAACAAAPDGSAGAGGISRLPVTTSISGSIVSMTSAASLTGAIAPALLCGSDGEDLVAGVQRVVLMSPNKQVLEPGAPASADSQLPAVPVAFPVDVSVYGPAIVAENELDSASDGTPTAVPPSNRVVVVQPPHSLE